MNRLDRIGQVGPHGVEGRLDRLRIGERFQRLVAGADVCLDVLGEQVDVLAGGGVGFLEALLLLGREVCPQVPDAPVDHVVEGLVGVGHGQRQGGELRQPRVLAPLAQGLDIGEPRVGALRVLLGPALGAPVRHESGLEGVLDVVAAGGEELHEVMPGVREGGPALGVVVALHHGGGDVLGRLRGQRLLAGLEDGVLDAAQGSGHQRGPDDLLDGVPAALIVEAGVFPRHVLDVGGGGLLAKLHGHMRGDVPDRLGEDAGRGFGGGFADDAGQLAADEIGGHGHAALGEAGDERAPKLFVVDDVAGDGRIGLPHFYVGFVEELVELGEAGQGSSRCRTAEKGGSKRRPAGDGGEDRAGNHGSEAGSEVGEALVQGAAPLGIQPLRIGPIPGIALAGGHFLVDVAAGPVDQRGEAGDVANGADGAVQPFGGKVGDAVHRPRPGGVQGLRPGQGLGLFFFFVASG